MSAYSNLEAAMNFLLITAGIFGIDMGVKEIIEETHALEFPKEVEKTKGLIVLHKNHNDGLPFGFLREKPRLVVQIPAAAACMAAGAFAGLLTKKGYFLEKLGLSLILGGGASNLYDRVKRGYVVDYVSIHWRKMKEVVFNLGDVAVLLGGILLIIAQLAGGGRRRN